MSALRFKNHVCLSPLGSKAVFMSTAEAASADVVASLQL